MKINTDILAAKMAAVAGNRYLRAIRDGMAVIIPVVVVGSFFTIVTQLPITAWTNFIKPFMSELQIPVTFSIGFMALYACYGIAASLAETYKLDKSSTGVVAVMVYLILAISPGTISAKGQAVTGILAGTALPAKNFGAYGLFTSMLAAIVTVEVIRFFKQKKIVIKMPDGVPPAVSNSFVALLPAAALIIGAWAIKAGLSFDVNAGILKVLSPLGHFGQDNFVSAVVPAIINSVFWIFGIHGAAISTPIFYPYWYQNLDANTAALAHGATAATVPHFMTEQFFQWFIYIGGSGVVLALTILLAFFSKSALGKTMGRIAIVPSVFNISEPIVFGLPIVLNPYFAVPFILAPVADSIITWAAMTFHLVNRTIATVPWTLPAPIGAFMATGFDWRAIVLTVINISVAIVIYWPFFKAWDKQQLAKETDTKAEKAA